MVAEHPGPNTQQVLYHTFNLFDEREEKGKKKKKIDLFNTVNYMQTRFFHKQDVESFSCGFKGMNVNYELVVTVIVHKDYLIGGTF